MESRLVLFFFLKKEEPTQVGTPIHHTLLYAKMFYKMDLAYSYTYRATETEPTEHRIEKKKEIETSSEKYFWNQILAPSTDKPRSYLNSNWNHLIISYDIMAHIT